MGGGLVSKVVLTRRQWHDLGTRSSRYIGIFVLRRSERRRVIPGEAWEREHARCDRSVSWSCPWCAVEMSMLLPAERTFNLKLNTPEWVIVAVILTYISMVVLEVVRAIVRRSVTLP